MPDQQEQVSGSIKAPTWAMGVILAALLGGGAILSVTGSTPRTPPQPAHDPAASQASALSRIEAKLDSQAAEIATVRESVAEIRGELKARKP